MELFGPIAHIAGWLMLGGVSTAALVGFGIWLGIRPLIYAGIATAIWTVGFGGGVYREKVVCDARFEVARAQFKKLQDDAKKKTDETADRLTGQLADKDKRIDELVDKYENLDATKAAACRITADDIRRGMR